MRFMQEKIKKLIFTLTDDATIGEDVCLAADRSSDFNLPDMN
jgi:hypothetical protein